MQANISLVRNALEGFFSEFLQRETEPPDYLHSEAVWNVPGSHQLSGVYKGLDNVLAVLRKARALGADQMTAKIHDIFALGEYVVVLEVKTMESENAEPIEIYEVLVYQVKAGKIVEFWSHPYAQTHVDEVWGQSARAEQS